MQLGKYSDGQPLNYDDLTGVFDVGGRSLPPERVLALSEAGKIGWSTDEVRAWFYALPAVTTPIVATAPTKQSGEGGEGHLGDLIACPTSRDSSESLLNKEQRIALIAGTVFIVLCALVPPWQVVNNPYYAGAPAGYALIFTGPQTGHNGSSVDFVRLLIEWFVIAVGTGVAVTLLARKRN